MNEKVLSSSYISSNYPVQDDCSNNNSRSNSNNNSSAALEIWKSAPKKKVKPNQILIIQDAIYVSDLSLPVDIDFIQRNKVSTVIECMPPREPVKTLQNPSLRLLEFNWRDTDQQTILDEQDSTINQVFSAISASHDQGESVLITGNGESNHALVLVAAFLLRRYEWSVSKSLEYLKSKKDGLEIRIPLLEQLHSYEKRLVANTSSLLSVPNKAPITWGSQTKDICALTVENTYMNSFPVPKDKNELKSSADNFNKSRIRWKEDINSHSDNKPHNINQLLLKSILKTRKNPAQRRSSQSEEKINAIFQQSIVYQNPCNQAQKKPVQEYPDIQYHQLQSDQSQQQQQKQQQQQQQVSEVQYRQTEMQTKQISNENQGKSNPKIKQASVVSQNEPDQFSSIKSTANFDSQKSNNARVNSGYLPQTTTEKFSIEHDSSDGPERLIFTNKRNSLLKKQSYEPQFPKQQTTQPHQFPSLLSPLQPSKPLISYDPNQYPLTLNAEKQLSSESQSILTSATSTPCWNNNNNMNSENINNNNNNRNINVSFSLNRSLSMSMDDSPPKQAFTPSNFIQKSNNLINCKPNNPIIQNRNAQPPSQPQQVPTSQPSNPLAGSFYTQHTPSDRTLQPRNPMKAQTTIEQPQQLKNKLRLSLPRTTENSCGKANRTLSTDDHLQRMMPVGFYELADRYKTYQYIESNESNQSSSQVYSNRRSVASHSNDVLLKKAQNRLLVLNTDCINIDPTNPPLSSVAPNSPIVISTIKTSIPRTIEFKEKNKHATEPELRQKKPIKDISVTLPRMNSPQILQNGLRNQLALKPKQKLSLQTIDSHQNNRNNNTLNNKCNNNNNNNNNNNKENISVSSDSSVCSDSGRGIAKQRRSHLMRIQMNFLQNEFKLSHSPSKTFISNTQVYPHSTSAMNSSSFNNKENYPI